jgi:all-trans-retinol dehydrogenase (NAD+)
MIERKRGHIVAIASIFGKMSFKFMDYSASKFGVRGFMSALYHDLCAKDQDEFIKLTTVYPAFINTRKELSEQLDKVDEVVPRMSPEYVADEVVKGMLLNKSDVTLPFISILATVME